MSSKGLRTTDKFGPDGQPKTESSTMRRENGPHGELYFDGKQPFILSREPYKPPKPKSKKRGPDVLVSTLDEVWSEMRTEELGRRVWYFKVWNETKGHEYTTEVFEGVNGEPCAVCICPAATVCKHILDCVVQVLKLAPDFGEAEKHSEFMVGIKHSPPGTESAF